MPGPSQPRLSLAEWLVLCLVSEAPAHGFALARTLSEDGQLGQIWGVPKPVIYQALQRLETLGLVATIELQPSSSGPVRSPIDVTKAGRDAAAAWLTTPARHNRDIRSELLMKLALLDRQGADPTPLLAAQRAQLEPVAEAHQERLANSTGFDRMIILWRWETVAATLRFLDDALREARPVAKAR
jgi:DNA-binding PadR family transcriptional regulator